MVDVVYFLRSESGKIKIGTTRNLRGRLSSYRTNAYERVDLIGCIPGGRDIEASVHAALDSWRMRGEWFTPSESVIAYIDCAIRERGCDVLKDERIEQDQFTIMAAGWVRRAAELLSSAEAIPMDSARDRFAERAGMQKGTLFNLTRARMKSITAADFERVREAYITVMEEQIASMRRKLAKTMELAE